MFTTARKCPYPGPDASSPKVLILFSLDPVEYCPPIYAQVFRVVSSLQVYLLTSLLHGAGYSLKSL
jgi:hypothetical protein